jgi:hypothetical protein
LTAIENRLTNIEKMTAKLLLAHTAAGMKLRDKLNSKCLPIIVMVNNDDSKLRSRGRKLDVHGTNDKWGSYEILELTRRGQVSIIIGVESKSALQQLSMDYNWTFAETILTLISFYHSNMGRGPAANKTLKDYLLKK